MNKYKLKELFYEETDGNEFYEQLAEDGMNGYTYWLEEKLLSGLNAPSPIKLSELYKLISEQKDLDPKIYEIVNDHFWELF